MLSFEPFKFKMDPFSFKTESSFGLPLVSYANQKELISWPLSCKVEGKLEWFCTAMGLGGETQSDVLTNVSTN